MCSWKWNSLDLDFFSLSRSALGVLTVCGSFHVMAMQLNEIDDLEIDENQSDAECMIPLKKLNFKVKDIYNDFDGNNPEHLASNDADQELGTYNVDDQYRFRYIVGDFNTMERNSSGVPQCRGVEEIYPEDHLIPELLKDEGSLKNYNDRVAKFRPKIPIKKPPVVNYTGRRFCIGQRLIVCDLRQDGKVAIAKRVARFITSSLKSHEYWEGYYAPINKIAQRAWDRGSEFERPYTREDRDRDLKMGGSKGNRSTLYNGKLVMPNFMYFVGANGYSFRDGNGLHHKTVAMSPALKDFMGAPVSLGCIRLEDYASKFLRWYLPRGARFFVSLDKELYKADAP